MSKKASWVFDPSTGNKLCSACKKPALFYVCGPAFARSFGICESDYCPNCGAPMRHFCETCKHFSSCDRNNPICEKEEQNND